MRTFFARLRRSEDGQALVEFALVVPLFLLLVLGILDFGQALNYKNDLNSLANQAARYAETNSCQPCTGGQTIETFVATKADGGLKNGSSNVTKVAISFCFPNESHGGVGEELEATATTTYTWLPLIGRTIGHVASSTVSSSEVVRIQVAYNSASTNAYTAAKCKPSFTIEKLQRLNGEQIYTTGKLVGTVGQKVEYEIIVKNTGGVPLKLAELSDPNCEHLSPKKEEPLAAGASRTYTCDHVLTSASGMKTPWVNAAVAKAEGPANEKLEHPSNNVEAQVEEPGFTIVKEQRVGGLGAFTKELLPGEVGQKVEYNLLVTNTGNTTIKFAALKDAKCSNIQPAGTSQLKPTEAETFTCEHTLAAGDKPEYTNAGSIEGAGKTKNSNTVAVKVVTPNFTIVKEQRVAGVGAFTTAPLTGEVGQKVEYKLIVTNTGETTIKFASLKDAKCTGILPAGAVELKPTESQTFTCEHTLVAGDKPEYTNSGSIEGAGKTKESNAVVVKLVERNFTISKEQRIGGAGAFTTASLTGEVGQKAEYKVIVTNTGNATINFAALKDAKCTAISPAGATELKTGEVETFACEHTLVAADKGEYTNAASLEGAGKTKESNTVVVKVVESAFTVVKEQRLKGEPNYTKNKLNPPMSVGKTMEYKVTVTNTGGTTIKFSALKDPKCGNIQPGGEVTLEPAKSQVYTCEHVLAEKGLYTNIAAIVGAGKEQSSNTVEIEVK